ASLVQAFRGARFVDAGRLPGQGIGRLVDEHLLQALDERLGLADADVLDGDRVAVTCIDPQVPAAVATGMSGDVVAARVETRHEAVLAGRPHRAQALATSPSSCRAARCVRSFGSSRSSSASSSSGASPAAAHSLTWDSDGGITPSTSTRTSSSAWRYSLGSAEAAVRSVSHSTAERSTRSCASLTTKTRLPGMVRTLSTSPEL